MSGPKTINSLTKKIEKMLADAVASGEAPQVEVRSYDLHNCYWSMGYGDSRRGEKRLRMTVSLLLDGQPIIHSKEQTVQPTKRGIVYEGRLGSVDIMETVLREALVLRWPEIGPALTKIKTTSYAVHAVGAENDNCDEHHVQVHLRAIVDGCDVTCVVSREGVDSIGLTFDVLVTIYHWYVWRVFRRLRGEKRRVTKH